MKIASKVFLIIGILSGLVVFGVGFYYFGKSFGRGELPLSEGGGEYNWQADLAKGLGLMIYSLVTLIIQGVALKKIARAKAKNELVGISVVTIIFANILAGIFMLCIRAEDLNSNANKEESVPNNEN